MIEIIAAENRHPRTPQTKPPFFSLVKENPTSFWHHHRALQVANCNKVSFSPRKHISQREKQGQKQLDEAATHCITGYSLIFPTRLDTAYTTTAATASPIMIIPNETRLEDKTRTDVTLLSVPAWLESPDQLART